VVKRTLIVDAATSVTTWVIVDLTSPVISSATQLRPMIAGQRILIDSSASGGVAVTSGGAGRFGAFLRGRQVRRS